MFRCDGEVVRFGPTIDEANELFKINMLRDYFHKSVLMFPALHAVAADDIARAVVSAARR